MERSALVNSSGRSGHRETDVSCEDTITAVILGETGSGKSSLIDLFGFWARESCGEQPKFEDAAKLSLIDKRNEAGGSQSCCQTIKPHRYQFDLKFEGRVYSFVLLDTPGMGDIEGLKQDDDNIQSILTFVEKTPSVNAIILMLNGSNCRVSTRTQYILQRLYGMCPKTFENHLYLMFSNTQLEPNFDWEKEIKVPIRKENIIPIDNLLYSPGGFKYASSNPIQKKKIQQNYLENKEILSILFQQFMKGGALRSDAYKDLRINRDKLRVKVSGILQSIQEVDRINAAITSEMHELQNNIKPSLELLRKKADMTTETIKVNQRSTPYHNTQCLECAVICHENCQLLLSNKVGDDNFRNCACMDNNKCKECNHDHTTHVHANFIYDRQIIKESLLTDADRQNLNATSNAEQQKQIIINRLNQRLMKQQQEKEGFKNELQTVLRELKALCPHYDYKLELQCAIKLLEEAELVGDKRYNPKDLGDLKTYFRDLIQQFDVAQTY